MLRLQSLITHRRALAYHFMNGRKRLVSKLLMLYPGITVMPMTLDELDILVIYGGGQQSRAH